MSGVYGRLQQVLEDTDNPREAARLVIEALRAGDQEIWRLGMAPAEWELAIDALVERALAEDIAYAAEQHRRRAKVWGEVKPRLEEQGCIIRHDRTRSAIWHVAVPGLNWTVDLETGHVDGIGSGADSDNVNEALVEEARRRIADKAGQLVDRARKRVLNDNNYAWCNKAKAYVDQIGDRPPIPAGGSLRG